MFIKKLKTKFKISVEVSCFLGLEIEHHKSNSITISQKGYGRKILKCFGFEECKPECRISFEIIENPSAEDIVRDKRVFCYIAGTVGYGITYHATETKGGTISWCSQRQAIVTTSTTEAGVIAASEAAKRVIWLCRLIQGIVDLREIPTLQVDNRAAVKDYHTILNILEGQST
ncbi:hypothetical protein TNCV_1456731 [Trichonephila clavipes]|nr:hypothetical protein TNCV_1456731 [Trichonephila clavipes]